MFRNHSRERKSFNPTRLVASSFAVIILIGTLLLLLPAASRDGKSAGLLTALFTATSSTCVTGLILVDTWTQWSLLGQVVILCMIQLGGLGFMTVLTLLSLALKRRIGLSERLLMVSTFNLNGMEGVVRVVRLAVKGTFLCEGVGALILTLCFWPRFGFSGALWRGIFHAVSAFCNAGFDLMGGKYGAFSSLSGFSNHPLVLLTLSALVVIGGLGFFVWMELWEKRNWKDLSLYSKMVLGISSGLLLFGMVYVFCAEFANPKTLGPMPWWDKLSNALFQSVTLRTAGFDAVGQGNLTESTKAMSLFLMFVGGSSGSTAGGLKTVTIGVLLLSLRAGLAGEAQVTLRGRTIPYQQVLSATTLTLTVVCCFTAASLLMTTIEGLPYLDVAFEVASAMATVGLTVGITPTLSTVSKLLLIALMYLGRVGILSFSIAFLTRSRRTPKVTYPEISHILIG
ncbi:MAG: potassium uptake protein, TrkH family [Oscillospiraceae bacterium]|nr:potassium uptake protein, TrkH family [Oscillospiraceae bacterium]